MVCGDGSTVGSTLEDIEPAKQRRFAFDAAASEACAPEDFVEKRLGEPKFEPMRLTHHCSNFAVEAHSPRVRDRRILTFHNWLAAKNDSAPVCKHRIESL